MSLKNEIIRKLSCWVSHQKDEMEREAYVKGIQASYKKLSNKKELTEAQKKEIQDFFSPLFGHSVPTEWHQYFTARIGHYSKLYIPTSEYKTNIIGRLNVYPLKRAYTDKNLTDILLRDIHQPHIFLKNMNGYFYCNDLPVNKDEAVNTCKNLGTVIIKPSLTGRGKGVRKITICDGIVQETGTTLMTLLNEYGSDYLIEELVCQHEDMSALNPTSINTIRIVTYRTGMDILAVYSVIRIGRKDQEIDNESAGGISTVINADGVLGKYAYGAPGNDRIEKTDSGVLLEGYRIPSYDKALNMVKHAHYQLPYFTLMGWDVAIEADGTPTLIEFNMTPDLSQSANGPAFGEYTEMILKDAMSRKNTWSRFALECMWRKN